MSRRTLLLQLDGSLPSLALMRLAAHRRSLGDDVELRRAPKLRDVERRLGDDFGRVYASLIFERTRAAAERLRQIYPAAVIGGTGWDLAATLEGVGVPEDTRPDYSDYPHCGYSVGFTQRGCRLSCKFCHVPVAEGKVRGAATVAEIWRGEPWPRELLLLDNDFFGQPDWRGRVLEIKEGGFKVCLSQGINARMISDEAAEALAGIDYFDADFRKRRLYTAWDSRPDEEVLFRGLGRLVKAGVPPGRITVYMLIGYWAGETEDDWLYRRGRLRDFGCDPYPMPFHRTPLTVGFQRWCVGHYDRKIPWAEWKTANCRPEDLGCRGKMPLPLFDR